MSSPTTPTTAAEVLDVYRRHLSRGRARLASMTGAAMEVTSRGAYVWDADGKEYLDCGGYGVFLLGHCHPQVVEAVTAQVRRHPMATRLLLEPVAATAASELAGVTPPGLDRVHFVNSGAEAVETAIKLARAQGKTRLISAVGGYHGKTTGALALTSQPLYQDPFRPLLPAEHVPFGDLGKLAEALGHGGPACLVLEPVQGEGGVVIPPPGYLAQVQRLCTEHGAFFVLDEIQTGMGRLGTWWGADPEDIRPDVLLVGKGLSGGVIPVAAAVSTAAAYAPFDRDPFLHTSTFAASPVAMAAAAAAVRAIAGERLVERAGVLGHDILARAEAALAPLRGDIVADIRGRGLLIGIEMCDAQTAGELVLHLLDAGLLTNHSLNAQRVVRLTPPAVLRDADLERIGAALTTAAAALLRSASSRPGRG
ncbi:aspartate aminotransferase family protein [Streptomyces sp. NPDC005279]|uniref:aspartate aminotransferase family protein n=1 Tax=Streptomyces sp. NPDC005279 TaxID=3364712 RepID=UPI0036C5A22E